jgi:hypothetical protein
MTAGPALLAGTAVASPVSQPVSQTSSLSYTGQGIPLDQQCDSSNTPYLLFIFTYGGNYSPTNMTLSGINVTAQSEMGNETHFTTAYKDPSTLIGNVSVSWTGAVGNAQLVISHGCLGTSTIPTTLSATPTTPTITTQPSCDVNEVVTPPTIAGVIWSPSGATTLAVGHSVTYTATPAEGYTFTAGAVTSYTFTNTFEGECEVPPVDVCANIPGSQTTVPKNYAEENGNCYRKVYVCKYVGTPGVDERLQTGQNPINPSVNSINVDPVVVGSTFSDAQGYSVVIAFDEGQTSPTAADCVTQNNSTVVVTPSACVLPLGVTGSVTYTVTNPNTSTVVYTVSLGVIGSQAVTVPAGASRSVTFNNLAAGTYTASVTGDNNTSTTATQTVVSTCLVGGLGGGGQVLGASTTVAASVVTTSGATSAVLGELTDTGTSTVLPTVLAVVMSLTAAGVMFSSRKFRHKITTFSGISA